MTSRLGPKINFWSSYLFLGLHHTKLIKHNQIQLPSTWRCFCKDGIFITQGFDSNMIIFTKEAFQGMYENISRFNIADPTTRLFSRMFLGNANFFGYDETSHISLPKTLLTTAELKKEIVLIGQGNYIEIWSKENWHFQEIKIFYSLRNPELFSDIKLCTN